jgi:CheY-like chemotaxis protein
MADPAKKILAVMSDLFFSVKINDAAKKLGMTAEFVKDKALALEKAKLKPPLIILDLNCDAADPLGLIAGIKNDPETAGIGMIGFVSHVQTELKQRAKDAGCDTVVARSVFAQSLPEMLERAIPGQSREAD